MNVTMKFLYLRIIYPSIYPSTDLTTHPYLSGEYL